MGSQHGAELSELVRFFMSHKIKKTFGINNNELYRDNHLIILKDLSALSTKQYFKKSLKIFNVNGLKIIAADSNLIQGDILDITFNLVDGKFLPYRKSNSKFLY